METKPILKILCGIPGSGKTTYCMKAFNWSVVSRDDVRFSLVPETDEYFSKETEVFNSFASIIRKNLKAGQNVIADATHITKASRKKLIEAINLPLDSYNIIFVDFNTDLLTCLVRNEKREGRKKVPASVMRRMSLQKQTPSKNEFVNVIGVEFI